MNDTGAADYYSKRANTIDNGLSKEFWDQDQYYHASNHHPKIPDDITEIGDFAPRERSGLDCAVPLAILHAGDDSGAWSATDDRVLKTLWEYVKSFEGMYAINRGKNWTEGWVVGRYKEDIYNGIGIGQGNPWYVLRLGFGI